MKEDVKASEELTKAYNKIQNVKNRFGNFHKCVFHMHSPASYDYRLIKNFDANDYKNCSKEDVFMLCIQSHVFPKNCFTPEYFDDKDQFGIYHDAKECLSYLLMAQKILDMKLELVVITDHNTISGYKKLTTAIHKIKKVKSSGIYPEIILGVELTCADKNHVVGIFDNRTEDIKHIQEWLDENILSETDGTYLTSFDVLHAVNTLGGISYIAHIDTSNTFSDKYLSGAYKKKLFTINSFRTVGLSDYKKREVIEGYISEFVSKDICFVVDEDAHTVDEIGTKCIWIKGSKRNFGMIRDAIRDYRISIDYRPPAEIRNYIKGVYINGDGNNYLSGKHSNDFILSFSDSLNCIIGGRGTGKSTILKMLDFVIRQHNNDEQDLEFICNHQEIWLLFIHDKEEFMIHFFAPVKEYNDDPILKYFTDNRSNRYNWKYYYQKYDIEEYALKNYIEIDKIRVDKGIIYSRRILNKKHYLEKFFHASYSINDLVRTASSENLDIFIYNTLFQNKILENASGTVKIRSKEGLKKLVIDTQIILNKRRQDVLEVIEDFNSKQDGLFRIVYKQEDKRSKFDFEEYFNKLFKKGIYYRKHNIEVNTVGQYLDYLQDKVGILQLLSKAFKKDYVYFNEISSISEWKTEMSHQLLDKGISEIKDTQLLEEIFEDIVNSQNIDDIIEYLKIYMIEIETFELEFNLNSKETNITVSSLYKNVKFLSLGQKVVAMLSFILGYSEYAGDYTPFIIDQPEDNLDNQYIYKNLVKQLRDIKSKRQVIIATHNATIVTNAKAEQVIIMESDNKKGWVEATGYPNEKKIKKHIINYLEGGVESFKHKCYVYDEVIKEN